MDLRPLEGAIAELKASLSHKDDGVTVAQLEQQVQSALAALEARPERVVDLKPVLDGITQLQQETVDVQGIKEDLDRVSRSLALLLSRKDLMPKLEAIQYNFVNFNSECREALRRIEKNQAELKGATHANAEARLQAMHFAFSSRPQSVPVEPSTTHRAGLIRSGSETARASDYAPSSHPGMTRSYSHQEFPNVSRFSRSPIAQSEGVRGFRDLRTPSVSPPNTDDLERTPKARFQPVSIPEKESILSCGKEALMKKDADQYSLQEVFEAVNDPEVLHSKKGFIPVSTHIGTKLTDEEWRLGSASAIVRLVEENPSAINYPVWLVPKSLNYRVRNTNSSPRILGMALNSKPLPDKDKISWLVFAAMHDLNDLVSYLLVKGADKDFQREEGRTFLHLAAHADALSVVEAHYAEPLGGGGVPLIFDAACAPTPKVLQYLVNGRHYSPDLLNTPQPLMATASVELSEILRPGIKVNALHLAILRENEEMLDTLLQCEGLRGDTRVELDGTENGPTPLLLLLRWISKKDLGSEHIAVKAVVQFMSQLVNKQGYSKDKFTKMEGEWIGPQKTGASSTCMSWSTLLSACPKASRIAIKKTMPRV